MEIFIKKKDINIVFFTNDRFSELNKKIRDQSNILGADHFLFIDTDKSCGSKPISATLWYKSTIIGLSIIFNTFWKEYLRSIFNCKNV
mgnify:CR=1 FL=1